MRLALITQDFPPKVGGIQTYSYELAKRFENECDTFCVVAPKTKDADECDRAFTFPVKRISSTEPLLGWLSIPFLPDYLRSQGIDTVFHTLWSTLPVSVYMKRRGIIEHIYLAAHGRELLFNPFRDNSFLWEWYERYRRKMLSYVDHFFPVSEYTAELLKKKGVPKENIKVVINGTDPQRFYPMEDDLRQELKVQHNKILLTTTRLVSRKGVDTVIKALPEIIKYHPDVVYLIVGEGDHKFHLEQLVEEMELQHVVRFIGKIPYEDLIRYYNTCDVFVMPSKTEHPDVEGFGLVFLEANACGKPVIGSMSGGIPDAINHEQTGLLVEEQNHDELAKAVNRLFGDPEFAKELGQKGRERVIKEANWDQAASHILNKIAENG